MKKLLVIALVTMIATPLQARDLFKTLADPPTATWNTSNHADLKFCIVTSIAARTGRASTVIEKGSDTLVIVHNWSSAIAGDDVRGIFTIKADGSIEFRGQKEMLMEEVAHCSDL